MSLAWRWCWRDGSVTWLGGRTREAPGYDLRGVFIGSEGTFGITTKLVVRLLPLPQAVRTFLAAFPDVETACSAVSNIIARGIVPAALEMMDALTIRAVQSVTDAGYPDEAGAVLLIEIEGTEEEVDELEGEVEEALQANGADEVRMASSAAERERLWVGRKGALGALGSLAPNYYLVDGVVPRTRLAEVLGRVGEVGEKHGLLIANVFHAGDGNLHPCILFDERQPGALEKATEAGGELLRVCVEVGGTLTGEHGVGLEKKAYMPLVFTQDDMDTMMKVRRAFSPGGSLQPGQGISRRPGVRPGGPAPRHRRCWAWGLHLERPLPWHPDVVGTTPSSKSFMCHEKPWKRPE